MTIRSLYRPSLLTRPVPLSRGWLLVGLGTLSWLAFVLVGYGLLWVLS